MNAFGTALQMFLDRVMLDAVVTVNPQQHDDNHLSVTPSPTEPGRVVVIVDAGHITASGITRNGRFGAAALATPEGGGR